MKRKGEHASPQMAKSIQLRLEEELERLKALLEIGYELEVVHLPDPTSRLAGEVKGSKIFIYEDDEKKAVEALRHEFLDYLVSQAIEPYRFVANGLIRMLNEIAYKKKEKVVEALLKLLGVSN